MRRLLVVLVGLAILGLAIPPAEPVPNVVLLVVDTLRADRLAPYGNTTNLTPFLNALATRSNVAPRTYAQAPWTNPSVASLFTSRYQSQHGITRFNSVLSAGESTLAESMKAAGYATAAFSANGLISKSFGFDQGFDVYKAELQLRKSKNRLLQPTRRAPDLVAEALRWLDDVPREGERRKPVFLYLQFMETHTPYAPPKELLDRVRAGKPPLDLEAINRAAIAAGVSLPDQQTLQDIEDVYDATVMEIDAALRDLFAALESRGMLDDSLVIVTADHGDEFGDHGGIGHGNTLYDEALRVPLLVRTPGQTSGGTIERLVSLIDLAPTVLELAGIAKPASFEGTSFTLDLAPRGIRETVRRSIARILDDRPATVAYSERHKQTDGEAASAHARAIVDASDKLIESADGTRAFYDLAADPREQKPVEPDAKLAAELVRIHEYATREGSQAGERELDEQEQEALKALGYVQ